MTSIWMKWRLNVKSKYKVEIETERRNIIILYLRRNFGDGKNYLNFIA